MSNTNPIFTTIVYRVHDTFENKYCTYGQINLYSEKGKSIWTEIGPAKVMLKYFQKRTKNELVIKSFKLVELIKE